MHSPRLVCRCLLFVAALLTIGGVTTAQQISTKDVAVTATLLTDTTAIIPGKPFTAGVQFEIDPGWSIYWQFGGDLVYPTGRGGVPAYLICPPGKGTIKSG